MNFYSRTYRQGRPQRKSSRLRLLLFLVLIAGFVKFAEAPHMHRTRLHEIRAPAPGIVPAAGIGDLAGPAYRQYGFAGRRVWGSGAFVDLGDRRTHLPGSLLSAIFPDEMILPSCLTQPPQLADRMVPDSKGLPVRDDWPGFYGAPWIGRADGQLIALLQVYAPRRAGLPVSAPLFQIYAANSATPDYSTKAPARFFRGSRAVLYRLFLNGPVRCLDLVVQNGENNGIGHLYYQKYNHYYALDVVFKIQQ